MSNTQTIELPRLEREHPARYEARTLYVTMGPNRSLDAVSRKLSKSLPLMKRWSTEDNWTEHAEHYDNQISYMTVQDAAQQHQEDLRAFRIKYGKAGDDLHKVSMSMLALFARHLQGKTIEDKHGNKHIIPAVEMNASTLGQIKAALQTAADLEALALRVGDLLNEPRSE